MLFSTINNRNFEKPSRNPSNKTKVNILFYFSQTSKQKICSTYAQSSQKCSNIKILIKIERKKSKKFSKILTKGI
jgi:hypothetical protein